MGKEVHADEVNNLYPHHTLSGQLNERGWDKPYSMHENMRILHKSLVG